MRLAKTDKGEVLLVTEKSNDRCSVVPIKAILDNIVAEEYCINTADIIFIDHDTELRKIAIALETNAMTMKEDEKKEFWSGYISATRMFTNKLKRLNIKWSIYEKVFEEEGENNSIRKRINKIRIKRKAV